MFLRVGWRAHNRDIKPDLIDGNLGRASLTGANLSDANLLGANFSGADFNGSAMLMTSLRSNDLSEVKGLGNGEPPRTFRDWDRHDLQFERR